MIVILGDSLALMRSKEGILEKDTYAYKLQKNYVVINKSKHGNATFKQLKKIKKDIPKKDVCFIIIQLGIVDCSPRIFTHSQRKILSGIELFSKRIVQYYIKKKSINRYEKTKQKKIQYTKISDYKNNMQEIINFINKNTEYKKIFLINIAHPTKMIIEKNFDIKNIINKYNGILNNFKNKKVNVIDLNSYTKQNPDGLLVDEHISIKSHDFIVNSISNKINKMK
jgi:acyl-CoA thioesterase I